MQATNIGHAVKAIAAQAIERKTKWDRKTERVEVDVRVRADADAVEIGMRYWRTTPKGDPIVESYRWHAVELPGELLRLHAEELVDFVRERVRYLAAIVVPRQRPAMRIRPGHFARRRALLVLRGLSERKAA